MAASSHPDEVLSNSTGRKIQFLHSPRTDFSEDINGLDRGFKHLRFNIIPGQENSFRSRFEKERFQRDFFQLIQLRQEAEKLKPVRSIKPDIARVIMKEQNKEMIRYQPAKERQGGYGSVSSRVQLVDPMVEVDA